MESSDLEKNFRIEAEEILNQAEDAFLELEKGDESFDVNYNEVFRAFHSLKGVAGMFDYKDLEGHMHNAESLFNEFRDKHDELSGGIVDYFLQVIDKARSLLKGEEKDFTTLSFEQLKGGVTGQTQENKRKEIESRSEANDRGIVFIVDDEPLLVKVIEGLLSGEGYDIYTFTSPLDVLEKLDETTPDLLISDYKMPEMTGLELIKEVFEKDGDISVIFVSAFLDKDKMKEILDYGVFTFLDKPIDEIRLLSMTRNAIAQSKATKLFAKSLSQIMYHYAELSAYLEEANKPELLVTLKADVWKLLEQKENLQNHLKRKIFSKD